MIKFWKSAAKGKTGCPVRPPEQESSDDNSSDDVKTLLDIHLQKGLKDYSSTFEKKSKLSLSLHDVLVDKKGLKYFILFMESVGKQTLINCWLELDNFHHLQDKINEDGDNQHHSKVTRAKSFDAQCKCISNMSQIDFCKDNCSIMSVSETSLSKNRSSTNSCGNIAAHSQPNCLHDMSGNCNSNSSTDEAIHLFKKYVALEAPFKIELSDNIRKSVITNICQPEGHIKKDCFKQIQDIVFNQIETNYFNDFIKSYFYIKAQIDILTSGSLDLEDILYNETILFYFTEYLEQENCRILLEFIIAVTHFRDNMLSSNTCSPDQAQADAIVLYDKYVSLQATSPVGFPTDVRLQIESDICREGGPLPTCFDLPYQIVFKTLSKYVKTFLESEIYYKYLSEMVHSINQMSSHHKSYSDCSSEFSISTQNTLLAMGDPVYSRKKRNHSVPDMTIDSNQLYNADALWQRKKNDGLSLGRVNSLGRFESKFEPDPDKKGKSVLRKMVNRFVPTNSSRLEEEMAWQIAHMIVKDVTDLTMAPPENDEE